MDKKLLRIIEDAHAQGFEVYIRKDRVVLVKKGWFLENEEYRRADKLD